MQGLNQKQAAVRMEESVVTARKREHRIRTALGAMGTVDLQACAEDEDAHRDTIESTCTPLWDDWQGSDVDEGSNVICIQACAASNRAENKLEEIVEDFDNALTVQQFATNLQCSRREIYRLVQDTGLASALAKA